MHLHQCISYRYDDGSTDQLKDDWESEDGVTAFSPGDDARENSLFDTGKMSRFFLGPEIFFVPYLTLTSTFVPNLTLPSNPLANGVNWPLKRRFCP